MVKSIIKEIIIILLLLVAIILALGVLFYDYIPTNKQVPSVANYSTPQSVRKELNESVTEDETVLVTYAITESDLKTYEKTKEYTKGKANPFSTYENETPDENDVTNTNSINTNTQSNAAGSNGSTNSNSNKNTFYNNTGTK